MAGQSWAKVRSALLFHATSHGEAFEGQVAPSEALTLTQLDTASPLIAALLECWPLPWRRGKTERSGQGCI